MEKQNIKRWKEKLLDLSLNNKALNHKKNKNSTINIVSPDVKTFLDQIVGKRETTIGNVFSGKKASSKDETITVNGIQVAKKDYYTQSEILPLITKSKTKNIIYTNAYSTKQKQVLRNLFKISNYYHDENAIDVLFFAVGYLKWYQDNSVYYAPLTFLNADLTQKKDGEYSVKFNGDELVLNETLVYKMWSEYNIDIEMPNYSNLSMYEFYNEYKSRFQEKIKEFKLKNWEIIDRIDLSIFHFAKIDMVKDIEQNENKIEESSFYKKLISDTNTVDYGNLVKENQVDQYINPNFYYHKLDSDSSQESAIQSAINGQSFVLEGPPGTGKSQTITNIITELIARGKKVLFVAEKKAALDVVYNNLKKIGLNDFALPIHDSNLDKKEIIQNLYETLLKASEGIQVISETYSNEKVDRYKNIKKDLNTYYEKITTINPPLNKSLYELYGLYGLKKDSQSLIFSIKDVDTFDENKLFTYEKKIDLFQNKFKNINFNFKNNDWYGLNNLSNNISSKENLINLIEETLKLSESTQYYLQNNLKPSLKISYKDNLAFLRSIEQFKEFLEHLTQLKRIDERFKRINDLSREIELYEKLYNDFKTKVELKKEISSNYNLDTINSIDGQSAVHAFNKANTFVKRFFSSEYRKYKKQLLNARNNKKASYLELKNEASLIHQKQVVSYQIKKNSSQVIFDKNFSGIIDLENIVNDLHWYAKFIELSKNVLIYENDVIYLLINWFHNKDYAFSVIHKSLELCTELIEQSNKLQDHFDNTILNLKFLDSRHLFDKLQKFIESKYELNNYLEFLSSYEEMKQLNLEEFANKLIDSNIHNDYFNIFTKRFYLLLIEHLLVKQGLSSSYNGTEIQKMKEEFGTVEKDIQKIAEFKVNAQIMSKIPNMNSVEGLNPSIKLLVQEANKDRRIMPFKSLFEKISDLITTIKPCLMMSPLAVSSFFKKSDINFDCVIFDEASQVCSESAIVALFRAKQHIIVGDEHQLPPTNFFNSDNSDDILEIEKSDTDDYDSILTAAKSFLPSIKLRWHYRSKFEELIVPSNKEIYHNLITFPSIAKPSKFQGIEFHKVKGIFTNQQNEVEANKILEILETIYKKYKTTKSVGIVTINKKQQLLIENKLDKARNSKPWIDQFMNTDNPSPLFVKNIETVQGDERDIIIISICYAPDANGRMYMRFGPINYDDGYKRLNVAFTRAKESTIIVSSISGDDISIDSTSSRGRRFLKDYLIYAENGNNSLDDSTHKSNSMNPFEQEVYDSLVQLGYDVRTKVGSSGYRIDLAIVHPKNPDQFVLGIECDGSTFHSSKSARDRDRLRQEILENRGWKIYRIWSTDWFKNKNQQIKQLEQFIQKNLEEIDKPKVDITIDNTIASKEKETNTTQKQEQEITTIEQINNQTTIGELFEEYPILDLINFYKYRKPFDYIDEIIELAAPVSIDEIKKFIPQVYGRQVFNQTVKNDFLNYLQNLERAKQITFTNGFIYSNNKKIKFRKATTDINKRTFANISLLEISAGILTILKNCKAISVDVLVAEIAKLCLYGSVNAAIKTKINNAINVLIKENKVTLKGDVIELN
ncbi:DUF4011 domain-containing protein [Mycoplasma sp. NEAQ87857]|uniref:DUF4011 domain-containing protein n=1 Tax=Mycoplasma sp. NEAQ87857 TaxID=2683967 RepID=UPI0013185812|nr:DUF4011 domain-containing protein [Mycoplasma sp. NEAQ87857]QGZ97430.1 DUF4011 domain-containing protein [Mycoplasma sp. NEAQ87857]